jgi:hypothetical protein
MTLEVPAEHAEDVQPWTGGSWESLTRDADEVLGADLEQGETLIGVPFCIFSATFREGDYKNAKTGVTGWYVSLYTMVAPEDDIARAIRRKRIPEENLPNVPDPDEKLVINEGGTGVYRQIVAYLEEKGFISITSDLPREGAYGESRYDVLPPEWGYPENGTHELRFDPAGLPVVSFRVRLLCPRGLRGSDYENEYTKTGRTRYIA